MRKVLQIIWTAIQVIYKITLVLILVPSGLVALVMVPVFVLTLLFAGGENVPLPLAAWALGSGLLAFLSWFLLILPGAREDERKFQEELAAKNRARHLKWERQQERKQEKEAREARRAAGLIPEKRHVYMVSGNGIIKIGISSSLRQRLDKHASQGLREVHATHEFESEPEARALEDAWTAGIDSLRRDDLRDGFSEATFATTAAWTHAQETWLEHTGKTVPIPFSRRAS